MIGGLASLGELDKLESCLPPKNPPYSYNGIKLNQIVSVLTLDTWILVQYSVSGQPVYLLRKYTDQLDNMFKLNKLKLGGEIKMNSTSSNLFDMSYKEYNSSVNSCRMHKIIPSLRLASLLRSNIFRESYDIATWYAKRIFTGS